MAFGFDMDFGNQRAGGVEPVEAAGVGLSGHGFGHAMGRKNNRSIVGDFAHFVDKHGAHIGQPVDDAAIVNNFMAHIYRCAIFAQRPFDDLHGPVHTGAKPARLRQG